MLYDLEIRNIFKYDWELLHVRKKFVFVKIGFTVPSDWGYVLLGTTVS